MDEKERILKRRREEISKYPKLKISEAKELYNKMLNTEDIKEKNKLREYIINGTLYIVYDYIDTSKFDYFNNASYSIEDIINSFCSVWISKIDEGILNKVNRYSFIFNYGFLNSTIKLLGINITDTHELTAIDENKFSELFDDYLNYIDNNPNYTYNDFLEYAESNPKYKQFFEKEYRWYNFRIFSYLINFFERIKESMDIDNKNINLNKTNIKNFAKVFISNGLEYKDRDIDSVGYNNTDRIDNMIAVREMVEQIFSSKRLSDGEKEVLRIVFIENKTLTQVAKEWNLSTERVRQILHKALIRAYNAFRIDYRSRTRQRYK